MRQVAAQGLAPLVQVLHLRRIVGRFVERDIGNLAVWNRNIETVAEDLDVFVGQLLGLVHIVLALAAFAHAKALDGLDQQHSGLPLVFHSGGIGGVHLLWVMTTTAQRKDVIVAHASHHLQRLGVTAEEVFAHKSAVIGLEGLVVTVQRVHHQLTQLAALITRQQRVPVAAPDQLDHVPARAAELAFKLLDDLAVAAHWAVQPLQVAVHNKNEVIEVFPGGQADGAQRLHLIHLAIAAKHPDLAVLGVGDATGVQVLQKTGLVDGHQWT